LKQGDSIKPLYSRPVARTMPSDQNMSRMKPGSAATSACTVGDPRFTVGWTMTRVAVNSSPGR
jgi:hypothetical protein